MKMGFVCIAAVSLLAALPVGAQQAYPTRVVRLVVPFPAGGPTEVAAKFFASETVKWNRVIKVAAIRAD